MCNLDTIQAKKILVIGDIMLDTYFKGDVNRISPEAPVPVFRKKFESSVLGGAANVAANLIAAGQNVSVMSAVGNDKTGEKLIELLEGQGINTDLIISLERRTTEKIRVSAYNNQQVLRMDIEDTEPLNNRDCIKMEEELKQCIALFNIVILSDYLKGLLTYEFVQAVIELARDNNIPVIIDVKDSDVEKYKGATVLKPNLKELYDLIGRTVDTDEQIINASEELRHRCHCEYVLTTCGARGMVLVGERKPYFIEAIEQEVFDVTGAGDTAIAYLGACMANGMTMRESVDIANLAAGIQVAKVGTSTVSWSEIRERMSFQMVGALHKIIGGRSVETFRRDHKDQKIVFTNGCFDILHIGHIRYLQEAAKLGDLLVVGLNSDISVKRLKGSERPINTEMERAEMLGSLGVVDYIVIFDEDTPLNLVNVLQPDVLVKGGDYNSDDVIGRKEVEARGGKLVLIPFVEGKSTTNIIEKLKG